MWKFLEALLCGEGNFFDGWMKNPMSAMISCNDGFRPDLKMVIDMVNNAMKKIPNHDGLILHSDQGWHYQHVKYQDTLKKNGIEQSMSRKGNCLDNAMMENFFGIMKTELLYSRQWNSMDEFKKELRKYIHYYNHERIKLRLNGMSPVQFRAQYA